MEIAHRALDIAAERIAIQNWPEYYDGHDGLFVGKEAKIFQTWSIAGFIAADDLLAQPEHVDLFSFHGSPAVEACSLKVAERILEARS